MMATARELDDLLAEQAIRRVLATYARGVDRIDIDLVRECYWPDATDAHGPFTGVRDEFCVWLESLLRRHTMTMHHLTTSLIEIDGEVAAVETYGVAYHCGEPAGDERWNNVAGFRYLDRFERRGGQWRIAARATVVEWVTPWERDAELSGKFGDVSRRDRTDPSYLIGLGGSAKPGG